MKLYYAPGACSLAPHIALREAGLGFEPVKTDIRAKTLEDGTDYRTINAKGAVPALAIESGDVLTENATILQYIGDQSGGGTLLPIGGIRRYRVLEWLTYISSEVHKGYGPLWKGGSASEKEAARQAVGQKFDYVQEKLGEGPFLTGDEFTVADAYLLVMLSWTQIHGIDLSRWPGLVAFRERVMARPAVREAMTVEGLIK